jgi:hypothetical protein
MSFLREHPIITLLIGAALGIALSPQLKRIPGVSKIPTV